MNRINNKNIITICTSFLVVIVCIGLFMKIDDRLVLHVDGFELAKDPSSSITLGRNSEVCYDKIPSDFMQVFVANDSISWAINQAYQDSLLYYKINRKNPNKHHIENNDNIIIATDHGDAEINLNEIIQMVDGTNNEYIMLRNLLAKKQIEIDTSFLSNHNFLKDRNIRSFIYRKKCRDKMGDCHLIILDNKTTLCHGQDSIHYCMMGSDTSFGSKAKVQFFKMATSAYSESKKSNEEFQINAVNYIAKPILITTEWGAGHILLERIPSSPNSDETVTVRFPKPITNVQRLDDMYSMASVSSGMLTFKQDDGSFLINNCLKCPTFSSISSQDICHIVFKEDSILCNNTELKSKLSLIPQYLKITSGPDNDLHIRVGIINNAFLWSCLKLPFLIFLFCWLSYIFLVNPANIKPNPTLGTSRFTYTIITYSSIFFIITLAFSICRIMIAFKLAYTYPYFDKMFSINIISVCFIMLLVYGLSGLINNKYISASRKDSLRIRPYLFPFFYGLGIAFCCFMFSQTNKTYADSALLSYLPMEIIRHDNILQLSNWNILNWGGDDMPGMTDLFFNLPYTLIVVNLVIFVVSTIVIFFSNKGKKAKAPLLSKILSKYNNKIDIGFILVYIIIPLLLLSGISVLMSGNYLTAVITPLIIIAMTWAISNTPFDKIETVWGLIGVFLLVTLPFLIPPIAICDRGYITNTLGLCMFIILLYCISQKTIKDTNERKFIIFIPIILVLSIIFIMGKLSPADHTGWDRLPRRGNLTAHWEEYTNSGYRYAESDAEFMRIMMHYMFTDNASDPLSNDERHLHPSISTGQSPVILNDVSIQSSFFHSYGSLTYFVYFGLLVLMFYAVWTNIRWTRGVIGARSIWRLLAVSLWVGSSLYLYLSYLGLIPFTGRLNPGYGVDSVGEALESASLIAFMLATNLYAEEGENS